VTKMLAMALLLHGGLLGGVGDEAGGVDGSGEGTWTLATPLEGFLAAQVSVSLFRAFPRGASWVSRENQSALPVNLPITFHIIPREMFATII
jgi:hypothetical protein